MIHLTGLTRLRVGPGLACGFSPASDRRPGASLSGPRPGLGPGARATGTQAPSSPSIGSLSLLASVVHFKNSNLNLNLKRH
jgi:hypothetical protein